MYGTAELADGTLTSSEVNGLKNVVVLPGERLVVGASTALAAVDWSTGATSATGVAPNDDAAGAKNCGLTVCGSDAGSVIDVMSIDESVGGVICGLTECEPEACSVTDVMSIDESAGGVICGLREWKPDAGTATDVMPRCDTMVFGVLECCSDAGGVVMSNSASAFRGVAA